MQHSLCMPRSIKEWVTSSLLPTSLNIYQQILDALVVENQPSERFICFHSRSVWYKIHKSRRHPSVVFRLYVKDYSNISYIPLPFFHLEVHYFIPITLLPIGWILRWNTERGRQCTRGKLGNIRNPPTLPTIPLATFCGHTTKQLIRHGSTQPVPLPAR